MCIRDSGAPAAVARDIGRPQRGGDAPVSYTHLDVYKRQVQRLFGFAGFDIRLGIHTGHVLLGGGVDEDGTIRGFTVNIAARLEPVSYTHLDVYKRQGLAHVGVDAGRRRGAWGAAEERFTPVAAAMRVVRYPTVQAAVPLPRPAARGRFVWRRTAPCRRVPSGLRASPRAGATPVRC